MPSVQQRFDSSNFARAKPKSNKSFLIMSLVIILLLLIGGLVYMIFYGKELLDSLLSS
jgi:flagellar basal body-associated protein FliL